MHSVRSKLLAFTVFMIVLAAFSLTAQAKTLYVGGESVDIKAGQGSFFPTVHRAVKGEALEVIDEQNGWYQVQTPGGPGWVFNKTLTSTKPGGFGLSKLLGTSDTSELDKTAGFKGFNRETEIASVRQNNLGAQMRMVDDIERVPFTVKELEAFQKQGDVGPMRGAK